MRRVVDVLNIVVSVFAGVVMIGLLFRGNYTLERIEHAASDWRVVLLGALGIATVLLNIALAILEYRGGVFRKALEITTEEGANAVSIEALERQLLDSMSQADDVADARIHLDARGEGQPVICRLAFKLRRQNDVMHRVDELKKRVRETFLRIIPSGVGIEISATVTDLVESVQPAAAQTSGSSASGYEFSGPDFSGYEGAADEGDEDEVRS